MLGNYNYSVLGDDDNLHALVLILHIFVSNIFLLNYLIAILSTVYEEMADMGLFAYGSNKYQYIERYLNAMKDEWGYAELVVHPPPINYLSVFLLISIFRNQWMLKASQIFSKSVFWLENCLFFFSKMLVDELLLIPLIYLKLIFNIMKVENNLLNALFLSAIWLVIGPFYLLHGLCKDMYYYVKLLYNYHEDDFVGDDQAKEDELQDKIVIYNEVIDTMRAIMNIFKYKQMRRKQKKERGEATPRKHESSKISNLK